ncbi:YeeE/YedE family protein [Myxococcus stipitatus]|uniref:DUF6691 family protein n=1 Tax=Myxococcus stipitatus TaxID=83455 RepID=UPI001F1E302B|nr:DUF6691 family protein [Myxococcus stipitatus]MCE9673443.1 YeeE/YedE family protein [Myxococcus stipitatus]
MKASLAAGLAGVLFAVGLGLGGMTDPAKVVGFLDVAGAWDPSLAFVMAGALGSHALLRRLILRRQRPVLAQSFALPTTTRVDARLVVGAALFGVGWGLAGYCPGPALVVLPVGGLTVVLFVAAMVAGMGAFRWWESARAARTKALPG